MQFKAAARLWKPQCDLPELGSGSNDNEMIHDNN